MKKLNYLAPIGIAVIQLKGLALLNKKSVNDVTKYKAAGETDLGCRFGPMLSRVSWEKEGRI